MKTTEKASLATEMLLRGEEWFEIYEDQPIAEHVEDTLNFHDGGLKEQIFIQKWWKTIV